MKHATLGKLALLMLALAMSLIIRASALADTVQLIRSSEGSGNLYEKLIVSSNKACFVKEVSTAAKRLLTPPFSIYYRLKTDSPNNEKDGYYRIGGPDGREVGWIKKEFVTSWNTRFGFDPVLPLPDRHFTVFADSQGEQSAVKFVGKDGRPPGGTKRFALISSVSAVEADDPLQEVVIFTGLVESGGARQQEQMSLYNLQLEIVFVIASTASMEHLIEVAREVTAATARTLHNMPDIQPLVHFGLV
ncbi:hypothetical protein LCGC14_2978430, partial [marine sediment metagenome]